MPELSQIVNANADTSGLQWLEYLFLLVREQGWEQKTIILSWNKRGILPTVTTFSLSLAVATVSTVAEPRMFPTSRPDLLTTVPHT